MRERRRPVLISLVLLAIIVGAPSFAQTTRASQIVAAQDTRSYFLDSASYSSLNQGRFSRPSIEGHGYIYSDLFAVYVEKGFKVFADTHAGNLGTLYHQSLGQLVDAGWLSIVPALNGETLQSSLVLPEESSGTSTIETDNFHGVYEKHWDSGGGSATLDASIWAGFPYGQYSATLTPTRSGTVEGYYWLKWWAQGQGPSQLMAPGTNGNVRSYTAETGTVDLKSGGCNDNFVIAWNPRSGFVEIIIFQRMPSELVYDADNQEFRIHYSLGTLSAGQVARFPNIWIGFLRVTDSNPPTSSELAIAAREAHSALSYPQSLTISYATGTETVQVTHTYAYHYAAENDWGISRQPIAPMPYGAQAAAPVFSMDSVWATINYGAADASGAATFTLSPSILGYTLPDAGAKTIDNTFQEAKAVFAAIDAAQSAQGSRGEWDGYAYHDARVIAHLLLIYPSLDPAYQSKVASIARKTLTSYYSNCIVHDPASNTYLVGDMARNCQFVNHIDEGALSSWLFYATLLYTHYVDNSFTPSVWGQIARVERGVENVVDWSGLGWANPAGPDSSGELVIETTMAFLTYYDLADQANNQAEMDRARYFSGLTQGFMLNVLEQPTRYWSNPALVGNFLPSTVYDWADAQGIPWDWANTVWASWMPTMWTSFSSSFINGVKQNAVTDWAWNKPQDPRFNPEYLNWNMLFLEGNPDDSEAQRLRQVIVEWANTNNPVRNYGGVMGWSEQAAQAAIPYVMGPLLVTTTTTTSVSPTSVRSVESTGTTVLVSTSDEIKVRLDFRSLSPSPISDGVMIGEVLANNDTPVPLAIMMAAPMVLPHQGSEGYYIIDWTPSGGIVPGTYQIWFLLWNHLPSEGGDWEAYAAKITVQVVIT